MNRSSSQSLNGVDQQPLLQPLSVVMASASISNLKIDDADGDQAGSAKGGCTPAPLGDLNSPSTTFSSRNSLALPSPGNTQMLGPPGFPISIGHTLASSMESPVTALTDTVFPHHHDPLVQPPQHHHPLLQQHGIGLAAHHAFYNAAHPSPSPSTSSMMSSFTGSLAAPLAHPSQHHSAPAAYQPFQLQQLPARQQQQVVVLLPSTARIDRLQFAQVVDAVSAALQRTVEFKDLLMTVSPTPLVVLESDPMAMSRSAVVDKSDQGTMAQRAATSIGVETTVVETKAVETQTEDSDMLSELLDRALGRHHGQGGNPGDESVVWSSGSDLSSLKQGAGAQAATSARLESLSSMSASSNHPHVSSVPRSPPPLPSSANDPWGGSSTSPPSSSPWQDVPPPAPASRSVSQHTPLAANQVPPPRAASQPPDHRQPPVSTATYSPIPASSSLASSRLGARGLRPSSLLTPSPPTSSTHNTTPSYFSTGPPWPLPNRPQLADAKLPPVDPTEITHPLTLVTPFRPANCGPAPFHVTLRNLRPTVTGRDLLHLARDLRSLVKIYYPPHAFQSFVGRAAVFFLIDEQEALGFSKHVQGQIQRGKLRAVYELTEADVWEAETLRQLGTVGRWERLLAVTMFRPGGGKKLKRIKAAGTAVVGKVNRNVKAQIVAGDMEWDEQFAVDDAREDRDQDDGDKEREVEVDEGDWKQWEADMCRLFDDECASDTRVCDGEQETAPIEWVCGDEVASLKSATNDTLVNPVGQLTREPSVARNFARAWHETAPNA